jgi:hypothetical protein
MYIKIGIRVTCPSTVCPYRLGPSSVAHCTSPCSVSVPADEPIKIQVDLGSRCCMLQSRRPLPDRTHPPRHIRRQDPALRHHASFPRFPIAVLLRGGLCEWASSAIATVAAARGSLSALIAASDAGSPPGASS